MTTRSRCQRARRGFTLIAVAVGLMVVAILAAVAAPYLTSRDNQIAAAQTAAMLQALQQGLTNTTGTNGATGFCASVTVCPKRLHHLTTQIGGTENPACSGTNYTTTGGTAQVPKWVGPAPYSGLPIVSGYGIPTPLGVVHDSLIRVSATLVEVHIDSMSADNANYLDIAIDGTANASLGSLQYTENTAVFTATGQHMYLVKFQMAITSGQC